LCAGSRGLVPTPPTQGSCKVRCASPQHVAGPLATPPLIHELVAMGNVGIFLPGRWAWFVWVRYAPCPLSRRRSMRRSRYHCQRRWRMCMAVCSRAECLRSQGCLASNFTEIYLEIYILAAQWPSDPFVECWAHIPLDGLLRHVVPCALLG